jgi:predicted CopG family antitoxin
MSRSPMQIDTGIKEEFDKMKTGASASDFLQSLLKYKAKEKNHLLLDDSLRDDINALRMKLGISDSNDLLRLLLQHFGKAEKMTMETFDYFLTLKKGR